VANDVAPERSFLLMAPSASGGTVTGDAIAGWPLGKLQLAVLSACRTASGAVSRGEGVLGLVRPFLAAGVPAVVGASWDVDDHATRVAITEFHAFYAATRDAPASLRRAQLKLKASPDPRLRDPGAWGAFIVMSGFPPRPSGVTAHGIS
jgi:CHAT domain-containing protein